MHRIILMQIIFHFLWEHWADWGIFENWVLLMYTLKGVSSVANLITAYEESRENRDFHLIRSVFFVSKGNLFDVYFRRKAKRTGLPLLKVYHLPLMLEMLINLWKAYLEIPMLIRCKINMHWWCMTVRKILQKNFIVTKHPQCSITKYHFY